MEERLLRDFFLGIAAPDTIARSLDGATTSGGDSTLYRIVDMTDEFLVEPAHLVRVCDAYLEGHLTSKHLQAIGFCLIASDAFHWDGYAPEGERITAVANDWASPEINHPINRENVESWRRYLLGDDHAFG